MIILGLILAYIIIGYIVVGLFFRYTGILRDDDPILWIVAFWPAIVIGVLMLFIVQLLIFIANIIGPILTRVNEILRKPVIWISEK